MLCGLNSNHTDSGTLGRRRLALDRAVVDGFRAFRVQGPSIGSFRRFGALAAEVWPVENSQPGPIGLASDDLSSRAGLIKRRSGSKCEAADLQGGQRLFQAEVWFRGEHLLV